MRNRFTKTAQHVIFCAQQEAGRLNTNRVDTKHILFGIISAGENSMATAVLLSLGLSLDAIHSELQSRNNAGKSMPNGDMRLKRDAMHAIDAAFDEGRRLKHSYISSAHLLLGLICAMDGDGGKILRNLGVDLESARSAYIQQIQETGEIEKVETQEPRRLHWMDYGLGVLVFLVGVLNVYLAIKIKDVYLFFSINAAVDFLVAARIITKSSHPE
jgi:ATP-dependent Clp protease ATP-binding subunit ClpA